MIEGHASHPVRTLLHLGCGGGHIDHYLQAYYQITGVDLSPEMLSQAQALNPQVTYLPGDMRDFRTAQWFDAVLIADSITYMLSESELRQAFATAYAHLEPGGVFCTYVEATPASLEQNHTFCSTHQGPGVEIAFLRNDYDPDPSDTTYEMTFVYLIRRAGKPQEIISDRHLAGIFPLETWQCLLSDAGFSVHLLETVYADPAFACVRK